MLIAPRSLSVKHAANDAQSRAAYRQEAAVWPPSFSIRPGYPLSRRTGRKLRSATERDKVIKRGRSSLNISEQAGEIVVSRDFEIIRREGTVRNRGQGGGIMHAGSNLVLTP